MLCQEVTLNYIGTRSVDCLISRWQPIIYLGLINDLSGVIEGRLHAIVVQNYIHLSRNYVQNCLL